MEITCVLPCEAPAGCEVRVGENVIGVVTKCQEEITDDNKLRWRVTCRIDTDFFTKHVEYTNDSYGYSRKTQNYDRE